MKYLLNTDKEGGIAPIFTEPVNLVMIDVEDKVKFTCQVIGKPQPLVKWYYGVEEIISSDGIEMMYNEETGDVALEMNKPLLSEATLITVEAQNPFGRAVKNVNVTGLLPVSKKPTGKAPRVTPLQPQIIPHGGTLVFESKFSGIPKPQIQWLRNGREIQINDDISIEQTEETTRIKIINMTRKRTGKYEVCAVNKFGEAKASGSVVVTDQPQEKGIKAPRFIQPLYPKCFMTNEVAILEVVVESEPLSSFQWFFNAEHIKSSNTFHITSQANKSTLVIENFNQEKSGPYTCRAENVGGSVTSTATFSLLDEMPLEVVPELQAPKFIEELPEYLTIMDGEALLLSCQVTGIPTPKISWCCNELLLDENKETIISRNAQGICQLHITEVFPDNTGVYKCVATNSEGQSHTISTVNVQGTLNYKTNKQKQCS